MCTCLTSTEYLNVFVSEHNHTKNERTNERKKTIYAKTYSRHYLIFMLEALCKNFVYTFFLCIQRVVFGWVFSFTCGVLQSAKGEKINIFFQFYFSFCTLYPCVVHSRIGKKCRHLQAHANRHTNTPNSKKRRRRSEIKSFFACQTRGRSRVEMMSMKKKQKMAIRQKMLCAKAEHIKPRAYARNKNFELEHSVYDGFKTECEKTRKMKWKIMNTENPKMHKHS